MRPAAALALVLLAGVHFAGPVAYRELTLLLAVCALACAGSRAGRRLGCDEYLDRRLPRWLTWKLLAFAAVLACGLRILLALLKFFEVWADIARYGTTPTRERAIRHIYAQATAILGLLWVGIAVIVALSILKPG